VSDSTASPKKLRRAGLKRIAPLLEQLRKLEGLRESRTAVFAVGSRPFLHFHYHRDGSIRADIKLSRREPFTPFDVSDEAGQQEVLGIVEGAIPEHR
jgi:hypothetical protein